MKKNKNFILRSVAGENILVATGEAAQEFNGIITLNDVASFIWENIDEHETTDELVESVLKEFDIDKDTAKKDVENFTTELIRMGMVIEE